MMNHQLRNVLFIITFSIVGLGASWAFGQDKSIAKKGGSIDKIRWGQHWAGPELATKTAGKNLKGKVVLLKIWGG